MVPREGTYTHAVYSILKANPASPVNLPRSNFLNTVIEALRDYYGLDVRRFYEKQIRKGQRGLPLSRHWLVGEWFGKTYVDYVADRRAKEEREARK